MDLQELSKFFDYSDITHTEALVRLILAGFSGGIIAGLYKLYHIRENYDENMMHSMIFIAMIICCAMMVIGNNLASAFGLVGAVSIIRFRTAVKSARDMSFVFFSVVIGMACGIGFLFLAIIGLVLICLVMIFVFLFVKQREKNKHACYKISVSALKGTFSQEMLEKTLQDHCVTVHFKSQKDTARRMTFVYLISLVHADDLKDMVKSLEVSNNLEKTNGTVQIWKIKRDETSI